MSHQIVLHYCTMETQTTQQHQWRWLRLSIMIFCITAMLGLGGSYLWAQQITAAGPPRTLWRVSLAGYDIGINTWPVTEEHSGYVEIWYLSRESDEIVPIFRLPGRPMAPQPRRLQPGEVLASVPHPSDGL